MRYLLPFLLLATPALADDLPRYPCPDAGPCKVITLTDAELKILAGQNGILQTAAQGRALELGQFVVYFTNKLQQAPAGEPLKPTPLQKLPPQPSVAPVEEKPVHGELTTPSK